MRRRRFGRLGRRRRLLAGHWLGGRCARIGRGSSLVRRGCGGLIRWRRSHAGCRGVRHLLVMMLRRRGAGRRIAGHCAGCARRRGRVGRRSGLRMCGTGISRERQTGCGKNRTVQHCCAPPLNPPSQTGNEVSAQLFLFGTVVQKNGGKGRVRHGIEGKNEQEMRSHSCVLSQRTCKMNAFAIADFGDAVATV